MNSNPKSDFLFWNNAYNWKNNCNNGDIMQNNSIYAEQFGHFRQHWQLPWCSISSLKHIESVYMERQGLGCTYSDCNPGQPRQIMRIIEKIMRIIVQEHSLRQLSIMYVCLPVKADELAFFRVIDTVESLAFPGLHAWVKHCCLPLAIFQMPVPCHNWK